MKKVKGSMTVDDQISQLCGDLAKVQKTLEDLKQKQKKELEDQEEEAVEYEEYVYEFRGPQLPKGGGAGGLGGAFSLRYVLFSRK